MMNNLNRPKRLCTGRFTVHPSVSPNRHSPGKEAPPQSREGKAQVRLANEYIRHRRMASLTFKQKMTPKGSQLVPSTNYSMLQQYQRAARTEKPTPLISPRMSTIKSLILTEIYSSRPLGKSTSHHPQNLGATTIIKSGHTIDVRHGSTGSRPIQIHKPAYMGSSRSRSKENVTASQQSTRAAASEAAKLVRDGIDAQKRHDYKGAVETFTKAAMLQPNNPDIYYHRGVAYLDDGAPGKAVKDLQKLVDEWPRYNKAAYLCLAMGYAKVPDTVAAVSSLNKAIALDHEFVEAYLARGQLLVERQKWQQALHDFAAVQRLAPRLVQGHIAAGDCFLAMDNAEKAISCFSQALALDPDSKAKVLLKRAGLYYKKRDLDLALADASSYLESVDKFSVEATLLLGKIQRRKGLTSDALINFEQIIKYDKEGVAAVSAIIKIARIKLKQKDFYGAHHTLQRPAVLEIPAVGSQKLSSYLTLTEAVLYLIKRKSKASIKDLTQLLKNESLSKYIRAQCHIYRGYGYMALHDFDNALGDYSKAMMYKNLGKSSRFNMLVCQAVQAIDGKHYDRAIKCIDEALELFPNNKETRFYRITIQVAKYQESNIPELRDAITKGLDEFIREKKNEHMLYYFRGILGLYRQEFMEALHDFKKAIDYCESVVAKYYVGRARCYACLSMFEEAMKDLTTAIDNNESLVDAYILRGKCAFINGDTKQAFLDFQKVIKMRPDDPMMHIHAANILMASGAYEQAIKAYTNAHKLGRIPMALYGRAKCNVALCNVGQALSDVAKVVKGGYAKFAADLEMLKIFSSLGQLQAKTGSEDKSWELALVGLNKLVSAANGKSKDEVEDGKPQLMDDVELANTSIFSQEDFVLYRAVTHFYMKDYAAALGDFHDANALMNVNRTLAKENDADEGGPDESADSELSDVGLCTLNKYEYMYNSMLCAALLGDLQKALSFATEIIDNAGTDYVNKMWMLRGAIFQALSRTEEAEKDFEAMQRNDPETAKAFVEGKESVKAEVFPEQGRLCTGFVHVKLVLGKLPAIMVRPSFSTPFVKPPGIIPYVDKSILNEFSYKAINCKPEAPWIKRCEHGIKFTDEIRSTIGSVESDSEDKPDAKPIYVEEQQYTRMKEEFSNVKLKGKSQNTLDPSLSFLMASVGADA